MTTQTDIFRRLVRSHMRAAPARIAPGATAAEAVQRMTVEHASSAVLVDARGRPRGILTEQDVVRRIAYRADPATPIEQVMTAPAVTVDETDYLFHAIAFMRRRNLRHIPVVDEAGALVGMLALHEALAVMSEQAMSLIEDLTHEDTVIGMGQVKAAQARLAGALFGDGVPVPEVQALLSDINRDLHRRVVRRELAIMKEDGWGEPPVPFALIIMGSGGRGENFLYPDQDNGFILGDYDDAEHARIDGWFLVLAERMTRTLDTIGFPLCVGNVMATNPLWRKPLGQWRQQIAYWMTRRSPAMLRHCDIFFDFCHGYGEHDFSAALRAFVTDLVAKNVGFVREMFQIQVDDRVALGWFGRLLTKKADDGSRRINLKYGGTLPLVEGIRILALRHGVAATSTQERIDALAALEVIASDQQDYLTGALRHITYLLLRQQLADFEAGHEVGNWVPVAALSKREREYLIACLRAIEDLRGRLKLEFTGQAL